MKKKTGKVGTTLPPVRIEKLVHGGAGLGFAGGPVFIPLTAPGDLVEPAEVRRAKGVYFAEAGRFLEQSSSRREPPCPWFGECGGCLWMHMDYTDQVYWKRIVAEETLKRIGRLEGIKFNTVHVSPVELGYRYRARIHIEKGKTGFFKRRSNTVVDWERCLLLPDPLNSAIKAVRSIIAYGTFPLRLQSLEAALSPVDGALTLKWDLEEGSASGYDLEEAAEMVESKLDEYGFRVRGQVFPRSGGTDLATRDGALDLKVKGKVLKASPGTFFQVNPPVNEVLVERVLDRLKRVGTGDLLDLFCGNGNFSIPAADVGFKVEGVDSNRIGIRDARGAAGDGCRFHTMDVERFLDERQGPWDAVLVDPPRPGISERIVQKLLTLKIPVLIYVSCEPATLARDLALLIEGGYVLINAELFDMFPQTPHAEVMAVLVRRTR